MPFPDVDPLIETFLEPTRVILFGKPFPTLTYDPTPMSGGPTAASRAAAPDREFETYAVPGPVSEDDQEAGAPPQADLPMPPGRVEQALRTAVGGAFARIYGFSFEGHYYRLPRPVLILVRGEGHSPTEEAGGRAFDTRFTGVESMDWQFGNDIRVWAVDKHDIAVCLDLDVGSYDQILVQPMTAGQEENAFRGAAASRGAAATRGAATFRGAAVGPHQDR